MIPVKITVLGDQAKGRELIGMAKGQLGILKRQRDLGLKTEIRVVSPFPGVEIKCLSDKWREEIIVSVVSPGADGAEWLEKKKKEVCVCNCNFTLGFVSAITGTLGEANLYSVVVCNNETVYVIYENILASDFTEYEQGEKVLLVPYNENTFQCCLGWQQTSGCVPKISTETPESDNWRTTYRIIPWCAISVPEWVEVN
jgi:hypothetical protein